MPRECLISLSPILISPLAKFFSLYQAFEPCEHDFQSDSEDIQQSGESWVIRLKTFAFIVVERRLFAISGKLSDFLVGIPIVFIWMKFFHRQTDLLLITENTIWSMHEFEVIITFCNGIYMVLMLRIEFT